MTNWTPMWVNMMPPIRWAKDNVTYQAVLAYVRDELVAMSPPKSNGNGRDKHLDAEDAAKTPTREQERAMLAQRAILDRLLGNLGNPIDLAYDTQIDFITVVGDLTRGYALNDPERLELVCALRWKWNKYHKVFEKDFAKPRPRTTD